MVDPTDGPLDYHDRARAAELLARANGLVEEADQARAMHDTLLRKACTARDGANQLLDRIPAWMPASDKEPAFELRAHSRRMAEEARRQLGLSETNYYRALACVKTHEGARRGLTLLYYRQFEIAEEEGDRGDMLRYLTLARAYDDGTMAAELSNVGALRVETDVPALHAIVQRYEDRKGRLIPGDSVDLGRTQIGTVPLLAGSHVVTVRTANGEIRYPIMVRRAVERTIRLHVPDVMDVPRDMVFVPGGPFISRTDMKGERLKEEDLPDFAISRFPVTFREYAEFLEGLQGVERTARTPHNPLASGLPLMLLNRDEGGAWHVDPRIIEGPARKRIPAEQDWDLPVFGISWYDAIAYVSWREACARLAYRLPTDLEWDKAARGADGRPYPMGDFLDPSFARLRESRDEPHQPEPVGAFPLDESPYGVRDMAGSMGEYTATEADGRGPLPDDTDEKAYGRLVLCRGGSWLSSSAMPGAMRYRVTALDRHLYVGFRLALSLKGPRSTVTASAWKAA